MFDHLFVVMGPAMTAGALACVLGFVALAAFDCPSARTRRGGPLRLAR